MAIVNQTLFDLILGPVLPLTAVSALGATEATYLSRFDTYNDGNWALMHADGSPTYTSPPYDAGSLSEDIVDYYGRDHINFGWYAMSGYTNQTYLDRANALARQYIDAFLVPNNGVHSEVNKLFYKGVSLYYAATGYAPALAMLGKVADFVAPYWVYGNGLSAGTAPYTRIGEPNPGVSAANMFTQGGSYMDGRINARVLEFVTLAAICGAPSALGYTWTTVATDAANFLITRRGPFADGQWRFAEGADGSGGPMNPSYYAYPWQMAMIWNALAFYYRAFIADSRIPTAVATSIQQTVNAGMWVPFGTVGAPYTRGWKYNEHPIPGEGGEGVFPSLNAFFIPGIAFAYARTGTTAFKTLAHEALVGLVDTMVNNGFYNVDWVGTPAYIQKQFNQGFWEAWVEFPMVSSVATGTGTLVATEAKDAASIIGRTGSKIRLNWV